MNLTHMEKLFRFMQFVIVFILGFLLGLLPMLMHVCSSSSFFAG